MMAIKLWYKTPGLCETAKLDVLAKVCDKIPNDVKIADLKTELCYYVHVKTDLHKNEMNLLKWIIATPFEENCVLSETCLLKSDQHNSVFFEFGPRLNFSTAFSTNVVSMCQSVGLTQVDRVECSTRYLFTFQSKHDGSGDFKLLSEQKEIAACLHDKMVECRYFEPIKNFDLDIKTEPVFEVDILGEGRTALEKANTTLGLAFDDWDITYYTDLFTHKVKRNPTSVECFDLAQSNSEHSRHWFFKGRMVVDGVEYEESLFKMVMNTQLNSNNNNVIKFSDNSSAIEGFSVSTIMPEKATESSYYTKYCDKKRHIIFTAETHNFPTGVAPFPGATTGTGGRIRDVQAAGRGAHVIAGTAGYSFGNLNIPGYELPWEDPDFKYPPNFARPLEIAIEASNGASDYGNKFGEPVLTGFARSFGLTVLNERREWVKPIMFSGGIGSIEENHTQKLSPEKGMQVAKVGGPVYRIGVGGGAASSIQIQGDNEAHLDFGAVQRGDAEMEQKLNRVIRACVEMGDKNPISSIHDQGAGGNGNVLKEISEPAGAVIHANAFTLGDPTLSVLELWGAEYQESNAVLVRPEDKVTLMKIGRREKCPVNFVGSITGDGKIMLVTGDSTQDTEPHPKQQKTSPPVNLDLELVLGSMPRKVFKLSHTPVSLPDLQLPETLTVRGSLDRVLRLPSVASKRYLTNKVDRSVSGLVAQQQCVGPLHTPLADVAVVALSHFDTVGAATAIGEQPIKGLVNPGCGARMTVGEALTNLVCAQVTDIRDVKCSGNWMWPAKLPGEGALLYDTCSAMCEVMRELGVAIDGGKDSLSMAARVGEETVKAPGTLVVSTYVCCPDITATLTPDLKCPNGKGVLVWVRFGNREHNRLGGSALAQCYRQLGNLSPDMDDPALFVKAFNTIQTLLKEQLLLSAHDVSDGGLITCVLEMAFAGNCGLDLNIPGKSSDTMNILFAEELGLICEVEEQLESKVMGILSDADVPAVVIGQCYNTKENLECMVHVKVDRDLLLEDTMISLRDVWEETSFKLELLQTNPVCVQQEQEGLKHRHAPELSLSFDPLKCMQNIREIQQLITEKPRIAIIREEGSNGDREMASAFYIAGFETWDVNMYDLCNGQVTLDRFRGLAFVGGFSYADAMGSAKGWAAVLKFNIGVKQQLAAFYSREDTFSLGVCNGCQLMALLGWVAPEADESEVLHELTPSCRLGHNNSDRFESRFVTVRIQKSPAIMLEGMENSVLGIWVQHGEGKFIFKDKFAQDKLMANGLVPVQYTDDKGDPTEVYPLNPNGSPHGIAALCSPNGRHLAMMPHPERSCLNWQWPWMPESWRRQSPKNGNEEKNIASPWLTLFYNAFRWCSRSD